MPKPLDLNLTDSYRLSQEIAQALNVEQLKQIGDELNALTGYGTTHVLSLKALAQAYALSGLGRAAQVARQLEQRQHQLRFKDEPIGIDYHGYREALSPHEEPQDAPESEFGEV